MKTTMNRRNYNNNRVVSAKAAQFTRQNVVLAAVFAAYHFGVKAFGFLQSLVTTGRNPYEGLNRGQLKQMYWLQYIVG
jgi:hypothetical protein